MTLEDNLDVYYKSKCNLAIWSFSQESRYLTDPKCYVHTKAYIWTFIADLFLFS